MLHSACAALKKVHDSSFLEWTTTKNIVSKSFVITYVRHKAQRGVTMKYAVILEVIWSQFDNGWEILQVILECSNMANQWIW